MGAFSEVDALRREFPTWKFSPFMRQARGKYVVDYIRARQLGTKRQLKYSSAAELAQKIREIERGSSPPADQAVSRPGEVGAP